MKRKFKFLLAELSILPEVKKFLSDMGFTNFKETENSPSHDLTAKFEMEDKEKLGGIENKILGICPEKIVAFEYQTKL